MNENNIADFICEIKHKLGCGVTFNLQMQYKALFDDYFTRHHIESINRSILSKMKIEAFKKYLKLKLENKQQNVKMFIISHTITTCIGMPEINKHKNSIATFVIEIMSELNEISNTEFFLLINFHICNFKKNKIPLSQENLDKAIILAFFNFLNFLH